MENRELIQKWLWMETMNYALQVILNEYKHKVYPDYEDHRHIGHEEYLKNIYTYAFENWEPVAWQGQGAGHNRYALGYSHCANTKGVSGDYNHYQRMEVNISWAEVKKFVEKMLQPQMQDRQMNLLELMAEQASGGI